MRRIYFCLLPSAFCFLAACASVHTRSVGTSAAPEQPWTPPADLVQKAPQQPPAPAGLTGELSLAKAIDIALSNNPDTRIAWLNARAAEANVGSAESAYLPTVDLNASATRARGSSRDASASTAIGATIGVDYLLFDFGGREADIEQARQTLIAADFEHNQAIQDVVLRTQQVYYGYLANKALLAAQEATIKERQTNLDAAEARHRAGVATIADVLQERTALSQAELTRETIEGNVRSLEGLIANVLGLPATTRFTVGDLPADLQANVANDAVEALITRAVAARPDLAAARANAERAQARVRSVRAQYMPTVSLGSSIGENIFSGGGHSTPYSAGVFVHFPLFTGGRNTYDVRAAEAQAGVAQEQARKAEQNVMLDVWQSYFAVQTAAQRLTTAKDLLASASQSADVAQSRYRAGVGSILDVLTAEAALESARGQEVQARADWLLALAQLAHDTGTMQRIAE